MKRTNSIKQNECNEENESDRRRRRKGENVIRYLKQFCEFTSIQGPGYIVKNVTFLERFWWISILILAVVGQLIMIYQVYDKYVTTPVLVSLATREKKIEEVPFPAVTICPLAKVSNECLNYTDMLQGRKIGDFRGTTLETQRFDFMSLLCKSENHEGSYSLIAKKLNLTELLKEDGLTADDLGGFQLDDYTQFLYNCSTMNLDMAYCRFMGEELDCAEVLTPILTELGLCYSFNMYDVRDIYSDVNTMEYFPEGNRRKDWSPDKGYTKEVGNLEKLYPRPVFHSGANNAFIAVFMTKQADINYACQDFALQGMEVTLHTPTKVPRPERVSFTVGLDGFTNAAVTPSYTETSEQIKHYDPLRRFCYFGYERQLKYFKYYSQSNCNLECFVNYTIDFCGCVNFYMPRDNETSVCDLSQRFCLQDARTNYTEEILRERLKLGNGNHEDKPACNCIPLCADLTYNTELSGSDWDWSNPDEVMFDGFSRNETAMLHASGIRVFFKDGYFLPSVRDELYGTTDMISNIGGIVNLFIGVSMVTTAEIIYFASFKLLENYRRHGLWLGPSK